MAGKELELLDTRLLQAAANGYSPEEMYQRYPSVGSAAGAAVRVKELLTSRDIWNEIEKQQLLLQSAYAIKEKMEELLVDLEMNSDVARTIDVYVKLLKTVNEILEKRTKMTQEELEKVTEAHARALLQLVQAGYQRARDLLAEEFPDVDLLRLDAAFNEGMQQEAFTQEDDD